MAELSELGRRAAEEQSNRPVGHELSRRAYPGIISMW